MANPLEEIIIPWHPPQQSSQCEHICNLLVPILPTFLWHPSLQRQCGRLIKCSCSYCQPLYYRVQTSELFKSQSATCPWGSILFLLRLINCVLARAADWTVIQEERGDWACRKMSKLGYLRSERGAYSQNRGGDIVENIRVTLRHNSSNENNGPVFVRINVGLQFVFRIYRPNCPHLFLNGNSNNFCSSIHRPIW